MSKKATDALKFCTEHGLTLIAEYDREEQKVLLFVEYPKCDNVISQNCVAPIEARITVKNMLELFYDCYINAEKGKKNFSRFLYGRDKMVQISKYNGGLIVTEC